MKLKIWIGILILSIGIVTYQVAFKLKPANIQFPELIAYDETGFIDGANLTDSNKLVASNTHFELYLNENNTYFKVVDKRNGEVWQSNPSIPDPWEAESGKITPTAVEKQKATLEVQYVDANGSLTTINNYKFAISHPESKLSAAGQRTYKIKYLSNGFQVLYMLEDLEVDYLFFPKFLPKETMETLEDRSILEQIAYTKFDEATGLYEIARYETMSRLVINRLYDIFYGKLGYTRERAIEENFSYGYTEEYEKIRFQIGIEVKLTDKGIETAIMRNTLQEFGGSRISSIALYPMFGTAISEIAGVPTEGYIVLPDGTGAIMNFNNGKYYQNPYRKRLYGQDLALLPFKMREQQQDITIPVFGMVKEQGGFAGIITAGDAMATINADVSGRIDSYNNVFVSFNLRESEAITLGTPSVPHGITLWTKPIVRTDFVVAYEFLTGTKNSYVGVAESYRNHLMDTYGLTLSDNTNQTIITAEFLGAYDKKEFFLGIPYTTTRSLTTFKQAQKIISQMQDLAIDDINVIYSGIFNGGLSQSIETNINIERVLGDGSGFNRMVSALEAKDIPVYASIKLMTVNGYRRFSDQYTYTAKRITGNNAYLYEYHFPTGLPYSETMYPHSDADYIVNPQYYQAIYNKLAKDFKHEYLDLSMLGHYLTGSYDKTNIIFKQDALRLQQAILASSDRNLMLRNPMGFAIPYANYITDLPTDTTLYAIIDNQVPLLQLALSGLVDYAGNSINIISTRSIEYNFLKAIETGSNLKYTLTYDDSRELLNTEYNQYNSTYYKNWLNLMQAQKAELDNLGIHQGRLIHHEIIAPNVYKVTYAHGLEIVINYNLTPISYQGQFVFAMNYKVVGGN